MTTRYGDNAGNGVTIGELREHLVDCIKLWTASRDLLYDDRRSIYRVDDGKTYRVRCVCVCAQVLLVRLVFHRISESGRKVGVIEPTVLAFQLKATIHTQNQSIFPSYNNRNR